MPRKIITYPDPVLCLKAEPVEEITSEIRELARDMAQTMYENRGIGLAAPQVNECVRVITVDISGPEQRNGLMTLVNPEIVSCEGEVDSEEGCLSVQGYRSQVTRSERVCVRALDLEGTEVTIEADDLLAVCLQHEIDHLNGILFIDRISRLKRSLYEKRLGKWLKKDKSSESFS
jgi:peptide deformylase